jgi:hypothetical protein
MGASHSEVRRFEIGQTVDPTLAFIGAYCAVVGLDLALRAYPAGDPIRDRAHLALLERLRARLHRSLRWMPEAPINRNGDLRAWDAAIDGPGWRTWVDAETVLTDAQALERRISLKARDSDEGHVVLLLADTRANRRTIELLREALRTSFPLDTRDVLTALGEGRDPGGGGIVIL